MSAPPREADVLAPELAAGPAGAILDLAEERLGRERTAAWVEEWGVDVRDLAKTGAWVALDYVERMLGRAAQEGGPEIVQRMGQLSISPRHMGPIYPFFRALASPLWTYRRMQGSLARYNKVHDVAIEPVGPTRITARLSMKPDVARPTTFHICRFIQGQLESVPTLFDLPPARVTQSRCMARGAAACDYEIEWREPARGATLWLPLLLGGAAGGTAAFLAGSPHWLVALSGIAGAVAVWAPMLALRQRRRIGALIDEIRDHNDALVKSVRENEIRFGELLDAKRTVDLKVEERTAELAEALEKVQELDRAKTDFFNNVSHELRTPLTLILGPIRDLEEGREPPGGTQAALQAMRRNAGLLLQRINQLLDIAKVEAGAAQLEQAPVDLGSLARRIGEGFRPATDARSIKLTVTAPEPMAELLLDAAWIESALTNLVANAVKAIPDGGHITVRIIDRGDSVRMEVEDDGPGIAPALLDRLFDRFAQGPGEKRRGTGLGLALVREAARLHGGEATATSDQGKGALFVLTLPRVVSDQPRTKTVPPPTAPAIPAPEVGLLAATPPAVESDRPGPVPDAPLALVVEDNTDLRRFLADVLAVHYQVKLASDGPGGLALARSHRPDVVVMDIGLPGMSGLDVTRALRAEEATRTTPIVLVTARGGLGQVLEGFDAGADDYLVKPFHGRELLARVGVHVRLRRMLERAAHRDRLANLGVLAASVAHNVRNPLTALVSGLPAMKQRLGVRLDEPSREMMEVMIECAERIERMTIDLLDLSRIDREPQGEFRPGAGLMAAVRLVSSRLPVNVRVTSTVDEESVILARPGDVNHVFLNLIDNAAKAVGERGEIRIEGALRDGRYLVTVADSGPGVDPALGDRIFDPFVTTRAAGEGTGLGLAIARDVVRNHGGTMAFGRSDLGGAVFTVAIPSLGDSSARPVEGGAEGDHLVAHVAQPLDEGG